MNPIDPNALVALEFQRFGRYASEKLESAESAMAGARSKIKGVFVDIYEWANSSGPQTPSPLAKCMADPTCKGAVGVGLGLRYAS